MKNQYNKESKKRIILGMLNNHGTKTKTTATKKALEIDTKELDVHLNYLIRKNFIFEVDTKTEKYKILELE